MRFVGASIVAVGPAVEPLPGDIVIDGGGLALAPGFIDTHSHHDVGLAEAPEARPVVSQGITTIVSGQDGNHPMPLAAALDSLAQAARRPSTWPITPATAPSGQP